MKVKLFACTQPIKDRIIGLEDVQDIIAYCAKVSNPQFQTQFDTSERLLNYLAKHAHWSPFEMANATLEIQTTRDIARQMLRHRSFSFQEFCVAGDTNIYFDLPKAVSSGKKALYKKTIKDLYQGWSSSLYRKQQIQKMLVRVYDEDTKTITHANIKEVFSTGVKPVFKITLENGKTITCTKEHKFLSENGFDSLENLTGLKLIGNTATMSKQVSLATNGIPVHRDKEWLSLAKEESIKNKTGVSGIAKQAGVSYHTIRKWLKIHNISFTKKEVASYTEAWNKGVFGYKLPPKSDEARERHRQSAKKGADSNLWRGGVDRGFRLQVTDYISKYRDRFLKEANYQCSKCGDSAKLELHHKVPVYEDKSKAFDLDNIEVLCSKCHDIIHGLDKNMPRGSGNKLTKRFSTIKYIEYLGEQDTYDLEIDHSSHNYVANGIITHNSQRYKEVSVFDDPFVIREARLQHPTNRQDSVELDLTNPEHIIIKKEWETRQQAVINLVKENYDWAIKNKIAKEQARAILPEGNTVSRLYMQGSIRSWIHYIELRSGNGTQKEHMEIAREIAKAIAEIFPLSSNFVAKE
jgi:thymidylate synthase (FAD)